MSLQSFLSVSFPSTSGASESCDNLLSNVSLITLSFSVKIFLFFFSQNSFHFVLSCMRSQDCGKVTFISVISQLIVFAPGPDKTLCAISIILFRNRRFWNAGRGRRALDRSDISNSARHEINVPRWNFIYLFRYLFISLFIENRC